MAIHVILARFTAQLMFSELQAYISKDELLPNVLCLSAAYYVYTFPDLKFTPISFVWATIHFTFLATAQFSNKSNLHK